ncbi:hypothetical protein J2783_001421 [Chryseobacterium sediminis]|nr:hypothetical protein [Chryseobacterium sediminis]
MSDSNAIDACNGDYANDFELNQDGFGVYVVDR